MPLLYLDGMHLTAKPMHRPLIRLFEDHFGSEPASVLELVGDGSNRTYYRLVGPAMETAVGTIGPDKEENRAFISYSRTFRGADFPVPEIYGYDERAGAWLQEDLGDTTLFEALTAARARDGRPAEESFPTAMEPVYARVLEVLPRFQVEGGRIVDFDVAYPRSAFDRQSIKWDLNYFKYHFLKLAHIPFSEQRLERDFQSLTRALLRADTSHFLYRDFQSRNIMLREGEPWFVDYQGGRRGALQYDVASILYDAKAAIPAPVRSRLFDHYLQVLAGYKDVDPEAFRHHFRSYVIVRVLQALGAYGYRGFYERKPRFLQSVPFAARNLRGFLERGLPVEMPELERVFGRIVEEWADGPEPDEPGGLTLRIQSFSYKQGYPGDAAGHGGGFVFDCRALPNPGRQLEYRTQSGLDEPVIEFLEGQGELASFWEHVKGIVDAQVEEYLRRGFESLTVNFGCTGGQHRSVYLSERLANHTRARFPDVQVRVSHREKTRWPKAPGEDEPGEPAEAEDAAGDKPAGSGDAEVRPQPDEAEARHRRRGRKDREAGWTG